MSQPNDLLGVPRAVVIAIALPGLVLFVGVMGFATHAGLAEFAPGLPSWAALALSAAVPLLALLGVGLYGALHDSPATSEATRRWTAHARLAGYALLGCFLLWRLGLL